MTSTHASPLEGAPNFRDLGGYRTRNGQEVRRKLIYRSGALAALTAADQQHLADLGIRFVCDLRSNRERLNRPTRWPESAPAQIWSRDHELSSGDLLQQLSHPSVSAEKMHERMIKIYETIPYEQRQSFSTLFSTIAAGNIPLIFHCAAGKDRTGAASALLLHLLDVPFETIIEDYLITERFVDRLERQLLSDPFTSVLGSVDRAIWSPVLRADRRYLEKMFATLIQNHGSIANYLAAELNVDAGITETIRHRLLEQY